MKPADAAVVRAAQAGLPLVPDPWGALAGAAGVARGELLARLRAMLDDGRIRRIGAVPNHYALGWTANAMSVWDVADDALPRLGPAVGALEFVSHCYRRPRRPPDWPYNLFAMVHGRSRDAVEERLGEIRALLAGALRGADALYSVRILKKTGLRIA